MTTPTTLIHTSVQDANTTLDIEVCRNPANALALVAQTFKTLETLDNPKANLRKALARAGRNALKQLQTGA